MVGPLESLGLVIRAAGCACVTSSAAATMNPPGRVSLLVYKGAWIAKGEDTLGTSNVDRKGRDSFQRSIFGLRKGRRAD